MSVRTYLLPGLSQVLLLFGGLLLAVATLLLLRARDRNVEKREADRLERLSEASSRLARLRDRDVVVASLLEEIPRFMPCRSALLDEVSVKSNGYHDPRRLDAPLVNDAGVLLGTVYVDLDRRPHPGDAAALMQLAESARAALETISLLEVAEAARRRTEDILSSMSDAMMALDGQRRLTYLNPRAASLFGGTSEQLLGQLLSDLLPARLNPRLRTALEGAVMAERGEPVRLFWPESLSGASGSKGAWVDARAFRQAGGTTLFMQDITRQVETEEQLRQTAKMEAVGQLTGGIAHDFNNLLTVILGNLEMLEDLVSADPMAAELVGLAQRSARSAAGLTARLLAFARRQPLAPSDLDVGLLIGQLGALLRRTLGSGVEVRIERSGRLWSARADAGQLENAILNLAINARDAMKGDGSLTIRLANRQVSPDDFAGELPPSDYAEISLSDTGCGIDPDTLARVFEPFFTTKPVGAGTGLGLSMVYGFAKQSGGLITLESEVGRGTVVRLLLPRGGNITNNDRVLREQVALPRGQGERILVVEDAALVRHFVVNVLESLGYAVTAVRDGPSALSFLSSEPLPNIVITDVMLPAGFHGQDVAQAAKRLEPRLPVVFMSGFMDHDLLKDVLIDETFSFIRKPFRRADLAVHVRRLLVPAAEPDRPSE